MKVLDLFSGIGGFSLGLERAGFETIAFCEVKPHARKILAKHWPNVPCADDINTLSFKGGALLSGEVEIYRGGIDLVCGGFPCQDLSIAGKREGFEGERSSLYTEMLRVISDCGPQYAIFENVTNLIVGESGRWFAQFLYDLAAVGYDAEWHCISASAIGANHHRDRIWVIAYPQGNTVKGSIFQGVQTDRIFKSKFRRGTRGPASRAHWEKDQPQFYQMDDGISDWVGDVSGYGNSVVPQIPEIIGNAIMGNL